MQLVLPACMHAYPQKSMHSAKEEKRDIKAHMLSIQKIVFLAHAAAFRVQLIVQEFGVQVVETQKNQVIRTGKVRPVNLQLVKDNGDTYLYTL